MVMSKKRKNLQAKLRRKYKWSTNTDYGRGVVLEKRNASEHKDRWLIRSNGNYDMMSGKAAKSKTFYGDTIIACVDRARCAMVYKRISEAMEESND